LPPVANEIVQVPPMARVDLSGWAMPEAGGK
jgi:hypothetical protein